MNQMLAYFMGKLRQKLVYADNLVEDYYIDFQFIYFLGYLQYFILIVCLFQQ